MLKVKDLNKKLVVLLYGCMLLTALFYLIAMYTPLVLLAFLSGILNVIVYVLIIISILYCGYCVIKAFNKRNLLYFSLSILSLSWFILLIFYASNVMENFN